MTLGETLTAVEAVVGLAVVVTRLVIWPLMVLTKFHALCRTADGSSRDSSVTASCSPQGGFNLNYTVGALHAEPPD